jgi:hypothetical protein
MFNNSKLFNGDKKEWSLFLNNLHSSIDKNQVGYLLSKDRLNIIKNPVLPSVPLINPTALALEYQKIEYKTNYENNNRLKIKMESDFEKLFGILESLLTQEMINLISEYRINGNPEKSYNDSFNFLKQIFGNSTPSDAQNLIEELNNLKLKNCDYKILLTNHARIINQLKEIMIFDDNDNIIGTYCPTDITLISILKRQVEFEPNIGKLVCHDLISIYNNKRSYKDFKQDIIKQLSTSNIDISSDSNSLITNSMLRNNNYSNYSKINNNNNNNNKQLIRCYNCGKIGHMINQCYSTTCELCKEKIYNIK